MNYTAVVIRYFGLFVALLAPAAAQRPPEEPQPPSYQVNPDCSVTFRLKVPKAAEVRVSGDFLKTPLPMVKDEQGLWTATAPPLAPAVYSYSFEIDGVVNIDPRNPYVKTGVRSTSSLFEVPAPQPRAYDMRNVPHGTVHMHWYQSKALGVPRSVWVYTPPGYDEGSAKYPILYLLHGSGDTEGGWVTVGRANLILDNLIADGKARPMVVAMPFGHPQAAVGFGDPAMQSDRTLFAKDLLGDVLPLVEKAYRVDTRQESRAIAGLSMGGGQALSVGLNNLDLFGSIGAFSAAARDLTYDAATVNRKLKLFWIACGVDDGLLERSKQLDEALCEKNVRHTFIASEGAHAWRVWQRYLEQFTPLLFR